MSFWFDLMLGHRWREYIKKAMNELKKVRQLARGMGGGGAKLLFR